MVLLQLLEPSHINLQVFLQFGIQLELIMPELSRKDNFFDGFVAILVVFL